MPRPVEESRFRRFMMQGIMWLILGATVGLAALVNQAKQHSMKVVLDAPRELDGFSIRLPLGWEGAESPADNEGTITLKDPDAGNVLMVSAPSALSTFISSFGPHSAGREVGRVSIAGRERKVFLYNLLTG